MSDTRDMLDNLIDIKEDLSGVASPFAQAMQTMLGNPSAPAPYNPLDYKERPRVNSMFCLNVSAASVQKNTDLELTCTDTCTKCTDICPVDAIEINGTQLNVLDDCRMCGLCSMVCPTETFMVTKFMAKNLYDDVARVASMYEVCYITCTRALGRRPYENEILLPCVGAIPREVWVALLQEYRNIEVFLPLGVCDRCKTTTGEEAYSEEIACAEELSSQSVGLETERKNLNHTLSRAFKRKQFVGDVAHASQAVLSAHMPIAAGIQAINQKIQKHSNDLYEMQCRLESALGDSTVSHTRRILTQKRKLFLSAIQEDPTIAKAYAPYHQVPVCTQARCTACGACARVCPERACVIDDHGRFSVEGAYCVSCAACAYVCPELCLDMCEGDTSELIIHDPEKERMLREKKIREERAREKARALKEKSKRVMHAALDALESLDE